MQIGSQIEITKMPVDSFYKAVRGTVLAVKGDWVKIEATEVMDKWSKAFEKHPTSCITWAKV